MKSASVILQSILLVVLVGWPVYAEYRDWQNRLWEQRQEQSFRKHKNQQRIKEWLQYLDSHCRDRSPLECKP